MLKFHLKDNQQNILSVTTAANLPRDNCSQSRVLAWCDEAFAVSSFFFSLKLAFFM